MGRGAIGVRDGLVVAAALGAAVFAAWSVARASEAPVRRSTAGPVVAEGWQEPAFLEDRRRSGAEGRPSSRWVSAGSEVLAAGTYDFVRVGDGNREGLSRDLAIKAGEAIAALPGGLARAAQLERDLAPIVSRLLTPRAEAFDDGDDGVTSPAEVAASLYGLVGAILSGFAVDPSAATVSEVGPDSEVVGMLTARDQPGGDGPGLRMAFNVDRASPETEGGEETETVTGTLLPMGAFATRDVGDLDGPMYAVQFPVRSKAGEAKAADRHVRVVLGFLRGAKRWDIVAVQVQSGDRGMLDELMSIVRDRREERERRRAREEGGA